MVRTARGPEFWIANPDALARLLRRAVFERHGGSEAEAARRSGIPRATLRHLLHRDVTAIRLDTVGRIRRLVGYRASSARELEGALFSPGAHAAEALYEEWLKRQLERHAPLRTTRTVHREYAWMHDAAETRTRERSAHQVVATLRKRYPSHWLPLDRIIRKSVFKPGRVKLAYYEVVAPLLNAVRTGGMELDVNDLSEPDLLKFIDAGITRALLLLKRGDDPTRLGRIAGAK